MKLISLVIHRNNAPSLPPIPFQPPISENDINIQLSVQFDDESKAVSFTSDVLKLIDEFRGLKV